MVEKTAQCAVFFEWIVAFGRSKGQCRRIGDDKCRIKNEELFRLRR